MMELLKTEQSPRAIIDRMGAGDRRILLFGEPGGGKSALANRLAAELWRTGRACTCIGADPGTPLFGIPGAVCMGEWRADAWKTVAVEGLCSLDAGRFRLPLTEAVRRLASRASRGTLLIDSPGVVRGVAGAELLLSLVRAAAVDAILCVTHHHIDTLPLGEELLATGLEILLIPAATGAHRPSKGARARTRTHMWDAYLEDAAEHPFTLDQLQRLGTPPPVDTDEAWIGRQVALLDARQETLAMGEIVAKQGLDVQVRMPGFHTDARMMLIRDAQRMPGGLLRTAKQKTSRTSWHTPPPDMIAQPGLVADAGPQPLIRMRSAMVVLINGIFGDPLLHLRLHQRKRSLLFDLGEAGRLPARIAHQVTDVFISHAHFDHIAGFLWLLRSRIGVDAICRVYGPPGLISNIQGFIDAIHWDRIGDHGPRFEVMELHGDRLLRCRLQAGHKQSTSTVEQGVSDGILLNEADFRVRAITLDHGTPVLAFAFESAPSLNIRREQLDALGLPAGPWLRELKQRITGKCTDIVIRLPGGRSERVDVLARQLAQVTPGQKMVYATDLADTRQNRARLTTLAQGAHALFCEAVFVEEEIQQAVNTGHLTARACGEIASSAGVEHLIPFHFSMRYEDEPERVYDEVLAASPRVVVSMASS